MKTHRIALVLGVQLLLSVSAFGVTNLLSNPSFEIDANADTLPDDWQVYNYYTTYGGGWTLYDGNQGSEAQAIGASDGTEMMELGVWYAGFSVIYQDVLGTPGDAYDFSADIAYPWGANSPPDIAGNVISLKIEFFDAGNSMISSVSEFLPVVQDNSYQNFSINGVAPAGTVYVRSVVASEYWGFDNNGTNWLADNLVLTPEPGALLGLLALGAIVVRRR